MFPYILYFLFIANVINNVKCTESLYISYNCTYTLYLQYVQFENLCLSFKPVLIDVKATVCLELQQRRCFSMQNDVCAEFDIRSLILLSPTEGEKFPLSESTSLPEQD